MKYVRDNLSISHIYVFKSLCKHYGTALTYYFVYKCDKSHFFFGASEWVNEIRATCPIVNRA